ncbi:phage antirepressor N-terminal domain-containing protein [Comamonas testosteroni]
MSNSTVEVQKTIPISFHGAELYVVEHNNQPYTPMKPIVEGMGLAWQPQHRKLTANRARWGITELVIPSAGGSQAMTCAPLRKLPGWMSNIEVGKIKSHEVRSRVVQYQDECDDVLWQYWNDGIAINPRALYSVNPGDKLTKDEAETLRLMLKSAADRVPKSAQGPLMMQGWSKLKSHFKVSYREIPRHEFSEAVSIIARHTAEWELVDDEPTEETLNEIVARLARQLDDPNGYHVFTFLPLYEVIVRKLAKNGALPEVEMPEAQAREVFTRINRLLQLFHPLSAPFNDVVGIVRALRGLDPDTNFRREGFLPFAHERMLMLH